MKGVIENLPLLMSISSTAYTGLEPLMTREKSEETRLPIRSAPWWAIPSLSRNLVTYFTAQGRKSDLGLKKSKNLAKKSLVKTELGQSKRIYLIPFFFNSPLVRTQSLNILVKTFELACTGIGDIVRNSILKALAVS